MKFARRSTLLMNHSNYRRTTCYGFCLSWWLVLYCDNVTVLL